jgi:hypothetical protein
MADKSFNWTQQSNYSWRGSFNGTPYWVILTTDHKQFILQIPGIFNEHQDLINLQFDSFDAARNAAEQSVN